MHAKTFLRAAKLRAIVDVEGWMAGVDEVGRGPLAGPVVAAAVILEEGRTIRGLNDSKLLTAEERERLDREIRKRAICVSVASASVAEIDSLNILRAALLAMRRAVEGLALQPQIVLVDGNQRPELTMPVRTVVGGDAKVRSISAASIIAKVHRDRLCLQLHDEHPQYGFDSHKGYSTPEHLSALREHGACPHHRRSFAPVRDLLDRLF
jgi:ribonuclease HII